ncbi:tRNA pseudouridine(55) synthase TruB [Synechococcales cyanobacterium C]|uniref:tRNA pseudouridine synthase B n=1 Tax=Petrachloros mirabilis ULC683 TaxID=2781853 RepID=A0A8K2A772_9CYAN|nr:tRNA pseudouridine(55) synthase TruB [Petrachloros mirabilis]NCJ05785.1 tRNA pseudouridine(55) synthase TruB [Petrachloros mirabilis ULC683]
MSGSFGFLNLKKPPGLTSHDCVARLRRLLHLKRIGHGGTLDPMAEGVLPMAVGSATRLLSFLPTPKVYRAVIRLGLRTTTDDITGETLATAPTTDLTPEQVNEALQQFQGHIQQTPPAYSAIQVNGQRLYTLARQGKPVEVAPRWVDIEKLDLLAWNSSSAGWTDLAVEIHCGSGTYIRAIARDLGAALQTGGTLAQLRRTQSCGFQLAHSLSFDEIATQIEANTLVLISPPQALTHLPTITLPDALAQRWCWGQTLLLPELDLPAPPPNSDIVQVQNGQGQFLGISHHQNSSLIPKIVIAG